MILKESIIGKHVIVRNDDRYGIFFGILEYANASSATHSVRMKNCRYIRTGVPALHIAMYGVGQRNCELVTSDIEEANLFNIQEMYECTIAATNTLKSLDMTIPVGDYQIINE